MRIPAWCISILILVGVVVYFLYSFGIPLEIKEFFEADPSLPDETEDTEDVAPVETEDVAPVEAGPSLPFEAGPSMPFAGPSMPFAGPSMPFAGPSMPFAGPSMPFAGPSMPSMALNPLAPFAPPSNQSGLYEIPSDLQMLCTLVSGSCRAGSYSTGFCNSELLACTQVMNDVSSGKHLTNENVYQTDKMGFYFCYNEYQTCTRIKDCGPGLGTSCNLTKDNCRKNFTNCIDMKRKGNMNATTSTDPIAGSSNTSFAPAPAPPPPPPAPLAGPSMPLAPLAGPTSLVGPTLPPPAPLVGPIGTSFPSSTVSTSSSAGSSQAIGGTFSTYTPSVQTVYPDQQMPVYVDTYTPRANTDINSEVERILSNSSLTPTIRQNIRQEVSNALSKELYKLNNQYEIDYVYL